MASRKPLTNDEGEVRELTEKDFHHFVPFSDLPEAERVMLSSRKRGPQKAPTKELVSIRLSQDVVNGLRATGTGWQSRVDEALRKWLQGQSKRIHSR
jgi:uncharacterized protein (DUF4415 family)